MSRGRELLFWGVMFFLAIALLRWFGGCSWLPIPSDPLWDDPEYCQPACDNLFRLNCPGWQGSPGVDEIFGTTDDIPCVDVCLNHEMPQRIFPRCTAKAESCEAVERCFDP